MNKKLAIRIESVSKQYRLGQVGTGTLSHDLNRWWYKIRGKEDPYLLVGDENDRTLKTGSDYVWALKDISFNVNEGEVLGIIGRNGAGKSTLLKILSKITAPSSGKIEINGRLASLLEVGTGFHPDMTGRENIYMNGTILGMSKKEVSLKLEEIVEFAGTSKYLDTPVKRYSSGMIVRLGFAVAAHLEPDILIVDEVLAVGDAEFQKKAIGKMKNTSQKSGRSVLFVSHNMASVKSLCDSGVVISNGKVDYIGDIKKAVNHYLNLNRNDVASNISSFENEFIRIEELMISNSNNSSILDEEDELNIECAINLKKDLNIHLTYVLQNDSQPLFSFSHANMESKKLKIGMNKLICCIPKGFLNIGDYSLSIYVIKDSRETIYHEHSILNFEIQPAAREIGKWMGKEPGFIKPRFEWKIIQ